MWLLIDELQLLVPASLRNEMMDIVHAGLTGTVVKVRGARGGSAPLLESEPSLPTAGPKLLNSTKNHKF